MRQKNLYIQCVGVASRQTLFNIIPAKEDETELVCVQLEQ